jgi:vacuolar protein sorting-associated protein 13A/C
MSFAVFKPSEFTIINTDGHSDFDIEHDLTLRDQLDRSLDLKLNYVSVLQYYSKTTSDPLLFSRHPESGGAFKVQIYSPYIVVNKTGLPFFTKSTKSARTGSRDSAGDTRIGE